MDNSQVDQPTNAIAASSSRRTLTRMLVILPVIGASGLLAQEAVQRWRQAAEAKKKKKKQKTFCLNGETIQVKGKGKKLKKKGKKLVKQGATPGACSAPPPPPPVPTVPASP